MPVRATPDGELSSRRWFAYMDAAAPRCPKGHLLYGVSLPAHSRLRYTCQHRERNQSGRCNESMLLFSIPNDMALVIRLHPAEFDERSEDLELDSSEMMKRLGLYGLPQSMCSRDVA